jgi:hypothetical protein
MWGPDPLLLMENYMKQLVYVHEGCSSASFVIIRTAEENNC